MKIIILIIATFLLHYHSVYAQNKIVVSKKQLLLYVVNESSDTIFVAPIGCGKNYGNKTKAKDNKTPEGIFSVSQIQNSSKWTHDFKDGEGERQGAYGPWFIRLKVPKFTGIGIHGTCFPETIGTRCSEGCIRMRNSDIIKLKALICVGTKCTILPDDK